MSFSVAEFSKWLIKQRKKWLNKKKKQLKNNFQLQKCNWCEERFLHMFQCMSCKLVMYCSRGHQKKDWNRGTHSVFCKVLGDDEEVFTSLVCLMLKLVVDENRRTFSNYWRSRGRPLGFLADTSISHVVYTQCIHGVNSSAQKGRGGVTLCIDNVISRIFTLCIWVCKKLCIRCVFLNFTRCNLGVFTQCIQQCIWCVFHNFTRCNLCVFTQCIQRCI